VLVTTEALLLISLAKDLISDQVKHAAIGNGWKVGFVMAATIGLLGVLFLVLERIATTGVAKTHAVVQALPLPVPMLAIHAAALVGLFYLYAWHQHLPVWPMAGAP
jgi:hypothetical protein